MGGSKKGMKRLLAASALFMPVIINKLVFFTAGKRHPLIEAVKTYEWRIGKVAYTVRGAGKPLVLIHGAAPGSSSAVWMKNVNELAKKYKVYTIDLLGYGSSERVDTVYTAFTYASLINDFIKDIVGKGAAVAALGEGAAFTLTAYRAKPENFKKLILVCPKGIDDGFPVDEDKRMRTLCGLPIVGESFYLINTAKPAIKNMLVDMTANSEKTKILTDKFYSAAHHGGALNRMVYASYRSGFMNVDVKPYIEELRIPTLIVWGELAGDYENMEKIQSITRRAEYAVFEDAASLPNYENAEGFNETAVEFLK